MIRTSRHWVQILFIIFILSYFIQQSQTVRKTVFFFLKKGQIVLTVGVTFLF
jgi:hypothetical protein